MNEPSSIIRLNLRWGAVILGVLTLIWMPVEDRSVLWLLLLSVSWTAWLVGWWLFNRPMSTPRSLNKILWIGTGSGLSVFPISIILMTLKAGVHDHGFVDFSNKQLITIAQTIPLWVAIGVILSMLWLKYNPPTLDE